MPFRTILLMALIWLVSRGGSEVIFVVPPTRNSLSLKWIPIAITRGEAHLRSAIDVDRPKQLFAIDALSGLLAILPQAHPWFACVIGEEILMSSFAWEMFNVVGVIHGRRPFDVEASLAGELLKLFCFHEIPQTFRIRCVVKVNVCVCPVDTTGQCKLIEVGVLKWVEQKQVDQQEGRHGQRGKCQQKPLCPLAAELKCLFKS